MIKLNKLTQAIATAALLVGASAAFAEEVTVPASVTVNNAIDFTFTGELNFGEIRAEAHAADDTCKILEMPANPAGALASVTPAVGQLCELDGGTLASVGGTPSRPEFTIAGVAPFTDLTLTMPDPATPITLVAAVGPDRAGFTVGNFSAYRTSGTAGNITLDTDGIGEITTTAAGIATFTVGAQIATHVGILTDTSYENDIPYEGEFIVTVEY